MKRRIYKWLGVIFGIVITGACSEFQEPQIDNAAVEIFVPRDSLHTDIATQLFYWYHVEGAAKYELQIVTPSFDRIDRLVLDTNISGNKFEFTLQPGVYEWSVRAYNFSSSTGYTVHTLFIDSTLDLTNQQIILIKPNDRDTSNRMNWVFSWQDLYNAEEYHFELWQPDFNGQLVEGQNTSQNSVDLSLPQDGSYSWRVNGSNSQGQTVFASRQFYFDSSGPLEPQLTNPPQGQFFNSPPINFSWQQGADNGSSLRDTLYLATDSSFTNLRRRIYSADRLATIDTLSPGIYYWRVRSFDKAGNSGAFSTSRQFTLQ